MNVALISLGCNKNLVDSEMILGLIVKNGLNIVADENEADYIIVNTCAFIADAQKESIDTIIRLGELKKEKCRALIITGCLANRYKKEIKELLPEVDLVADINDFESIIKFIKKDGKADIKYTERVLSTPPYTAYVKIADGCDNTCTYCIIPKLRGKYKSRTIEDIEEEVKDLAKKGVLEIVLVAQDTSCYGIDLYGKPCLAKLLKTLEKIDGIRWIRILYTYPEGVTEELLDVISKSKKICHYFDLPIQHINNDMLKMMGRNTTKEKIIKLLKKIKEKMPDATLRTSLIVGFPTETDEQLEELKKFVKSGFFDRLGVFEFSKEEGTAAAKLKGQILKRVKAKRRKIIMEEQQKVSLKKNKQVVGSKVEVLIEGKINDNTYFGRTKADVPEIDGMIFIESKDNLPLGDFVNAKVIGAKEYDLIGKCI
ncbi:MAG: 30S ribosomal protein S12 methylthiotransferase RimO [Clostridia bacterium]|nr:30S ribosomal protein S12 methylthiotransferase RimO [Clostridia bacterium]